MTVGAHAAAAAGGDEANMPIEARSLAHLAECLGEGSLRVHGMPVVSLREGRVVGVEALARWRTRGGQLLRAEEFLPRVDEAGLWAELDHAVLAKALRAGSTIPEGVAIGVNVSAVSLARKDLADWLPDLESPLPCGSTPSRA